LKSLDKGVNEMIEKIIIVKSSLFQVFLR